MAREQLATEGDENGPEGTQKGTCTSVHGVEMLTGRALCGGDTGARPPLLATDRCLGQVLFEVCSSSVFGPTEGRTVEDGVFDVDTRFAVY